MEPSTYPDSSFVVSLVSKDANSARACNYMARAAVPLLFTPLHRIECRNALRNAVARGELDAADCRAAIRRLDEDLREGLLVHTPVEWTDILRRADDLSQKYAARGGQRTIDLLHVAIALESGAKTFLTFDQRQHILASAAGLKIKP